MLKLFDLLAIGTGGFLGCCLRYALTRLAERGIPTFPAGTLISNVTAGILIGLFIGIDRQYGTASRELRLFVTTGFLGGLSTFSTFSIETVDLFASGDYLRALANVALNLGLSLAGVMAGLALAKSFAS